MSLVGQDAEHVCRWCACVFRAPLRKQWNASLFCQKSCRLHHRAEANRRYRARKKTTAERVAENRERNRVWAATHRSCRRARPWLLGEPPFGERLPCHLLRMTMYPKPTSWRFAHENMRHLHGMVSAILGDMVGIEHKMDFDAFRRQSAFNIHISGDDTVDVFAWGSHLPTLDGLVYKTRTLGHPCEVHIEYRGLALAPLKSRRRGRIRVRVTSITQMQLSNGTEKGAHIPTADAFRNELTAIAHKLGVPHIAPNIRCDIVSKSAIKSMVPMDGKYGQVVGWMGTVDLEANAVAYWLLRVASTIGLGSRVAFNFGRMKVEEIHG